MRRTAVGIGAVLLTLVGGLALTGTVVACSSSGSPSPAGVRASLDSLPMTTWPGPTDPSAAAAAAGLPMLGQEMLDVHYHVHLDVVVQGRRVVVPANIGIDLKRQQISALHTHDATGIVHIESARALPFTLGQFFTEWGQPLSTTQVGPVKAGTGEQIQVYRNGTLVSGNPATLRFVAHDEILVYLGPASILPAVPTTYQFPNGY